ncbi:fimbrial protein [Bordetella trematum]|uniref:fimbrial protein n=1 Tax=Bordetella trematum TaxID=123899 RepID=UPI0039896310
MRRSKSHVERLFFMAALSLASGAAWSQATLIINGNLTSVPCSVSTETVVFGEVPTQEFKAGGGMGSNYARNVTLTIGGCDLATLRSASLKFNGSTVPQISNGTGLALTPVAGGAKGLAITLSNNDAVHGTLGQAIRFDGSESYALDVASGKNTYEFSAAYIRIPGVAIEPGPADSSVIVTLTYS